MNKPYHTHPEELPNSVSEPSVSYYTTPPMKERTDKIPVDLLRDMAEYALHEHRKGHCKPHEEAMKHIKNDLGWS